MPRKVNVEDGIVEWFQSAPLDKAQMMVAVASGIVKRRGPQGAVKVKVAGPKRVVRREAGVEGAEEVAS